MTDAQKTQIARYNAIENAPQHEMTVVNGLRVDTFFDEESKQFVSIRPEQMSCGPDRETAIQSLISAMTMQAKYILAQE